MISQDSELAKPVIDINSQRELLQELKELKLPDREAMHIDAALQALALAEKSISRVDQLRANQTFLSVLDEVKDAYCESCVEKVASESSRLATYANVSKDLSKNFFCAVIPGSHGDKSDGFSASLACALGLIPKVHHKVVVQLDVNMQAKALKQFQDEVSLLQPDSVACWFLAARSIEEPAVTRSGFIKQIYQFKTLCSDPAQRLQAARLEYQKLSAMISTEKEIGSKVPFCIDPEGIKAAILLGHPFAVHYAPDKGVYYIGAARGKLGLSRFKWHSKKSGYVESYNNLVRVSSLAELKEILGILHNKFADEMKEVAIDAKSKTQRLYHLILDAVAKDNRESVGMVTKALVHYKGKISMLEGFLISMRTWNPLKACARAQVLIPSEKNIPEHLRAERSEEKKGKGKLNVKVRGQSGHMLVGDVYCLYDPANPNTIVYFAGSTGIIRPFEAFRPDRLSDEMLDKKHKERSERIGKKFRSIARQEINEASPSVRSSRLLLLRSDAIDSLDQIIRSYRAELDKLVYANNLLNLGSKEPYLVKVDLGGEFWGWFKRNFDTLPEEIKNAYCNLTDALVSLPPDIEEYLLGALIAYQALNSHVSKQVVLADWELDLQVYAKLPADHPLRKRYGNLHGCLDTIRHITSDERSEITYTELRQVLSQHPMDEIREELNRLQLNRYTDEYKKIVKAAVPLFVQDGSWQEECLQGVVPMSTLKDHPWSHTLTRDEYFQLLRGVRLLQMTANDKQLCRAMSCLDFAEHLEVVKRAARKIKCLEKQFGLQDLALDGKDPDKLSKVLSNIVPRSNKFITSERFEEKHGMNPKEVYARYCGSSITGSKLYSRDSALQVNLIFDLVAVEDEDSLSELIPLVENLIPASDPRIAVEHAALQSMIKSPFFRGFINSGTLKLCLQSYYKEAELKRLKGLGVYATEFRELQNANAGISAQDFRQGLRRLHLHDARAAHDPLPSEKLLGLAFIAGEQRDDRLHIVRRHNDLLSVTTGFTCFLPNKVKALFAELDDFVQLSTIPGGVQKLKFITSYDATDVLKTIKLKAADKTTWALVHRDLVLESPEKVYIHKDLLLLIEELSGPINL